MWKKEQIGEEVVTEITSAQKTRLEALKELGQDMLKANKAYAAAAAKGDTAKAQRIKAYLAKVAAQKSALGEGIEMGSEVTVKMIFTFDPEEGEDPQEEAQWMAEAAMGANITSNLVSMEFVNEGVNEEQVDEISDAAAKRLLLARINGNPGTEEGDRKKANAKMMIARRQERKNGPRPDPYVIGHLADKNAAEKVRDIKAHHADAVMGEDDVGFNPGDCVVVTKPYGGTEGKYAHNPVFKKGDKFLIARIVGDQARVTMPDGERIGYKIPLAILQKCSTNEDASGGASGASSIASAPSGSVGPSGKAGSLFAPVKEEGTPTKWTMTIEGGPTAADCKRITVTASSKEEAQAKGERWAKKNGRRFGLRSPYPTNIYPETEQVKEEMPMIKRSAMGEGVALAELDNGPNGRFSDKINYDAHRSSSVGSSSNKLGKVVKEPLFKQASKPARVPSPKKEKIDLSMIWRKVEDVIGRAVPDGDPIDYLAPWLKAHGIPYEMVTKAARKNGYKDMYAYYDVMIEHYNELTGDDHQSSGGW